ncbi:hypothetical protein [Allomesorhizobium camelthorni]|uniref:Uncharacterized protein n=1 Tax=Allomesorhizobium camelthorni TaxID=475069 RepID=A0A6G4W6U2_9HYPH|nr:hypothetical protein [Mesorhizobium camelthorni]NGO50475.1 hypothetical protein [Mesorhizobium camelthorni]
MRHLGTFQGKNAHSAPHGELVEPQGDTLTSIIFAVIVMYVVMACGFTLQ